MIYDVRHVTEYQYETKAASAKLALYLTPRTEAGQVCVASSITTVPRSRHTLRFTDYFGNIVVFSMIETPFETLKVEAVSRLSVTRPLSRASVTAGSWAETAAQAFAFASIKPDSPVHFLFQSPRITLDEEITQYASVSFPAGRSVASGARDLARRIKADFAYSPDATDASTPLQEAFKQRCGVCQDFSHIMIAGLRGLGLPAAYVSGYIRTIPPAGKPRLAGADASHAWVSVWCGEDQGWLDLDPTNACDVGNDHILLARGRDFSDVSPAHGVFLGSGAQSLRVSVDVAPLRESED